MATKLIGKDDATASTGSWSNYLVIDQYTCQVSGSCTEIRVKVTGNVTVKVAIYADSSDSPGSRIARQDTGQACTSGWNAIQLESPVNLTQNTKYWLAAIYDADYAGYVNDGVTPHRYKAQTYSGFTWPTSLSGLTTLNGYPALLAGWESITAQTIIPSTVASAESVPTPTLIQQQFLLPSAISSAETIPTPAVILMLQEIAPSSIESAESIPTPTLVLLMQLLLTPTIASAGAFGTPTLGYIGLIVPSSIPSQEEVPIPTVVRFTYHVILDGRFIHITPAVNRVYVIGKDQYGNPVFGTSSDSDEISLVGERLDFQQELSVPSDDDAADVAAAMVAKRRLSKQSGFIVISPNAGQELWDVIWIKDTPTAQVAQPYRVTGIHFEYLHKGAKPRLIHKLILGAM